MKKRKDNDNALLGTPGTTAKYHYIQEKDVPKSVVRTLILTLGAVEEANKTKSQWLHLQAKKNKWGGILCLATC